MELLKHDEKRKGWTDREWIEEFYEFLLENPPDDIHLTDEIPALNLSQKQAWRIIWYLQEHFPILPDNFERCDECGYIYDAKSEGAWSEKAGKSYCDDHINLMPEEEIEEENDNE